MYDSVLPELLIESLSSEPIWITIKGNSMSPCLEDGTSVLVGKPERISTSDILLYRCKDELIAHRLIRRLKDKEGNILYQTKADRGFCLDEPIYLKDILGKAIAIRRKDRIVRLDSSLARINSACLWFLSLLRLMSRRYVKI